MAGLFYEDFEIGQVFDHPIRRTVTETDNVLFTTMTHNPARLHLDEEYCKNETEFGQRIVNSCFTLSLMVGVSVYDTTLGTTVGCAFHGQCFTAIRCTSAPKSRTCARANRGQTTAS